MKSTMKHLWFPLVVPIVVVSVALYYLTFRFAGLEWSCADFATNLLTEAISILVTVVYVESIMNRHRIRKWKQAKERIELRLRTFYVSSVISLRIALGLPGISELAMFTSLDYSREYPKFRALVDGLKPVVRAKSETLSVCQLDPVVNALERLERESQELVALFGDKLAAGLYGTSLDVHLRASRTLLLCPALRQSMTQQWTPATLPLRSGIGDEFVEMLSAVTGFGNALV